MQLLGQWVVIVLVLAAVVFIVMIATRSSTRVAIFSGGFNAKAALKQFAVAAGIAIGLIVFGMASTVWKQVSKSNAAKAAAPDEAAAIKEIIRRTESTMRSVSAPTGLLGAKWIQSAAQVKAARPNAVLSEPGELSEVATVFGRQANISYTFGEQDMLTLISVVIPNSSPSFYEETQKRLVSEYGTMSLPKPDTDYDIASDRSWPQTTWGKVGLTHGLLTTNGIQIEVIGFYLTFKE